VVREKPGAEVRDRAAGDFHRADPEADASRLRRTRSSISHFLQE